MCIQLILLKKKRCICAIWEITFYAYLPKPISLAYFLCLSARSYSKSHCQYQIRFVPYLLYLDNKTGDR